MSHANTSPNNVMINPDDAVMLLIDHRSGLYQSVTGAPLRRCSRSPTRSARTDGSGVRATRPWRLPLKRFVVRAQERLASNPRADERKG